MMAMRIYQLATLISCYLIAHVHISGQEVVEFDLENGMHVIVNPIEEASDVAVETFYRVGFVNEPENMVQAAHLLEHLVCYSPGAGFKSNEAMTWLNDVGMANAETLPDMTHYDYAVPAEDLEKVLQIEASRLQQTGFERGMLIVESKRVYQETDFVENNPDSGMLKHAFMSLAHAWKFQSKETLIRGGLEDFKMDQFHAFYTTHYSPRNLTLIISGKTTTDEAKQLVQKYFADIPAGENVNSSISWENVPQRNVVGWDSKHSAVCVAWKPPADFQQQLLLTIIGADILQKASNNKSLKEKCTMVMTSYNTWKVGELPMFIYGMARPDEDLNEIENMLDEFMQSAVKDSIKSAPQLAKAFARNYQFQMKPTAWPRAMQTANYLSKNGGNDKQSIQQVILQDALNRGIANHFLGDDMESSIEFLKTVTKKDFQDVVGLCITDSNQIFTQLIPTGR